MHYRRRSSLTNVVRIGAILVFLVLSHGLARVLYTWGLLPTSSDLCDSALGGDSCRTFWNMAVETVGGGLAGYTALHVISVVLCVLTAMAVVQVIGCWSKDNNDSRDSTFVSVYDDESFTKGGVLKH